ncbi:hypothetical protein [Amycolatopsis sp. H20-H5]|uniref:hypothetical protein n=1 Tax=Amycolatopsis sp. H20-H5 TaxID=3046309 RepID=UPI002DBED956|nr:hypothetical protein [Amycolatopsis sp. H20-H5]MEC3981617.1 hypothetical protein [Amycolatopsis sp. H20-H5]
MSVAELVDRVGTARPPTGRHSAETQPAFSSIRRRPLVAMSACAVVAVAALLGIARLNLGEGRGTPPAEPRPVATTAVPGPPPFSGPTMSTHSAVETTTVPTTAVPPTTVPTTTVPPTTANRRGGPTPSRPQVHRTEPPADPLASWRQFAGRFTGFPGGPPGNR